MLTFASSRRRSSRSCWRRCLSDRSSGPECSLPPGCSTIGGQAWRTPAAACCCSPLLAASAQVFNLLTPDTGLLHILVSVFFLVQLLTTLTAVRDRVSMLRSLAVLLGCAFVLRFIALESLYSPGRGVIKRVMTALMEGITLGALDYVPTGSATGYVAFLCLALYLVGLVLMPTMPTMPAMRTPIPSVAAAPWSQSGNQPRPTSCTATCPRFGASERRSSSPAASNCSVIRRVSCSHFFLEGTGALLDARSGSRSRAGCRRFPSCCDRPHGRPSSRARASRRRWLCGRRARRESSPRPRGPSGASAATPGRIRVRRMPPPGAAARRAAPDGPRTSFGWRRPPHRAPPAARRERAPENRARSRPDSRSASGRAGASARAFQTATATSRNPCSRRCSSWPAARQPAPPRTWRPPVRHPGGRPSSRPPPSPSSNRPPRRQARMGPRRRRRGPRRCRAWCRRTRRVRRQERPASIEPRLDGVAAGTKNCWMPGGTIGADACASAAGRRPFARGYDTFAAAGVGLAASVGWTAASGVSARI